MFIQVTFEVPIHWPIQYIEVNEIEVQKNDIKIQFEALQTVTPSFYETVCRKYKSISWIGRNIDKSKFFVDGAMLSEYIETPNEEWECFVRDMLKDSVLTNIVTHLNFLNDEIVEVKDLRVSSVELKDELLRKTLCEIQVQQSVITN